MSKKGFTLIEMSVVVVIIGILSSALIPRLASAQDKAYNAAQMKDLNDIMAALELYKLDSVDSSYPTSPDCNGITKTDCTLSGVASQISQYMPIIPKGKNKWGQWTIASGYIIPADSAYAYVGMGNRYILTYRFQDIRDGQIYKAVRMPDTRRRMAQNLNYQTLTGSYCYNNTPANCLTYGRLYTWDVAMSACPDGRYLPSADDRGAFFKAVKVFVPSPYNALLKVQPSQPYLDQFGFSIILAGYSSPGWNMLNQETLFWGSTQTGGAAFNTYFRFGNIVESRYSITSSNTRRSVRCIKK